VTNELRGTSFCCALRRNQTHTIHQDQSNNVESMTK